MSYSERKEGVQKNQGLSIALFCHLSSIGGAGIALVQLAKALHQAGHRVYVVFPNEGPIIERFAPYVDSVWITHYDWWVSSKSFSFLLKAKFVKGILLSSIRLARYIKRKNIDLVITNDLVLGPSAALAAKLKGIPHIWYVHAFGQEDHGFSFIYGSRISYKVMDWLSACLIVVSKAVHAKLIKVVAEYKLHVIYNPSPLPSLVRARQVYADSVFNIVMVGKIAEGKRQLDLIDALHILRKRGLSVTVTFVGSEVEAYKELLVKKVDAYGLGSFVTFVGFAERPYEYMAGGNAIAVCSRMEAFGMVTVEAMKVGKPVIASNSGANSELIQHERNGLLYRMGDAEDLADKIMFLYRNRALGEKMAKYAKQWASQTFTQTRYREEVEAVISKIMDTRRV